MVGLDIKVFAQIKVKSDSGDGFYWMTVLDKLSRDREYDTFCVYADITKDDCLKPWIPIDEPRGVPSDFDIDKNFIIINAEIIEEFLSDFIKGGMKHVKPTFVADFSGFIADLIGCYDISYLTLEELQNKWQTFDEKEKAELWLMHEHISELTIISEKYEKIPDEIRIIFGFN